VNFGLLLNSEALSRANLQAHVVVKWAASRFLFLFIFVLFFFCYKKSAKDPPFYFVINPKKKKKTPLGWYENKPTCQ
jgi:hypothetical protein